MFSVDRPCQVVCPALVQPFLRTLILNKKWAGATDRIYLQGSLGEVEQTSAMLIIFLAEHSMHVSTWGGKAGLLIRKHDHFTPARKMRRDARAQNSL